jgi:hypothetical protein
MLVVSFDRERVFKAVGRLSVFYFFRYAFFHFFIGSESEVQYNAITGGLLAVARVHGPYIKVNFGFRSACGG